MSDPLTEYLRLLENHDWYYDYSDDFSVWSRGNRERKRLDALARQVDPERTIWRRYAPQ